MRAAKLSTHPFDMKRFPVLANIRDPSTFPHTTIQAHDNPSDGLAALDCERPMIAYAIDFRLAQPYLQLNFS